MSLTKVTYSMINGAVANVLDFGAVGDGVADDTAAIQAALASGAAAVYLPSGTYAVDDTIKVSNNQKLFGDGIGLSIIVSSVSGSVGYANYAPAIAMADENGSIALNSKNISRQVYIEDFTIKNLGQYSVGVRYAGVFPGGVRNIAVYGDDTVVAGSRTSLGFVLMGLNKSVGRGCFYSYLENIYVYYQKVGFIYGNRANSNGPLLNLEIFFCDVGLRQDNGSDFSYDVANLASPATMVLVQPNIEAIHSNAIENLIGSRVAVESAYIDTVGGNGIVVDGSVLHVTNVRFASITGDNYNLLSGSIRAFGANGLDITGTMNRVRNANSAVELNSFWDLSKNKVDSPNIKLLSATVEISPSGAPTASLPVLFSDYQDLETNIFVGNAWAQVRGSTSGGSSNSLYNVALSDVGTLGFSSTGFTIQVRTVDNSNITDVVRVGWFVLAYLP